MSKEPSKESTQTTLSGLVNKIPKPSIILITGRRGSGKDATAVAMAIELHKQTSKPIYSDYNPKEYSLPAYWHERQPGRIQPETIVLLSDAHLELFSREWHEDTHTSFIKLVSVARHRDIDVIYTTQLSAMLDREIVGNLDVIAFKEPSTLADKFERPEVKDMTEEAARCFDSLKTQREKWEAMMAFTHFGTYWVTGIEKPPIFTEKMSKVFGAEKKPFWRQII